MLKAEDLTWMVDKRNLNDQDRRYQYENATCQARWINNSAEARGREVCKIKDIYAIYSHYDQLVAVIEQQDQKWVVIPRSNRCLTMEDIIIIHRILDAFDSLENGKVHG